LGLGTILQASFNIISRKMVRLTKLEKKNQE
jgi:hypothetical protein